MHLTVQQLSASLDGALTGPSLELVVRHLAVCHECRDRQARLAKHDDALRRLLAQDPDDLFLDDLTRRTEAIVVALSRGLPAPAMVTSVPLLHEEDPHAPAEPPPLPSRSEFGHGADLAHEAGFGRIGAKPTAPTHAPYSDPAEAQRLLDAIAGHEASAFGGLAPPSHPAPESAEFSLPDWASPPASDPAPGDVRRIDRFFERLDEHVPSLPRDAAHEPPSSEPLAPAPPSEPALAAASGPHAWSGDGFAPAAPAGGFVTASQFAQQQSQRQRHRNRDRAVVLAFTSVAGLAAVVLAFQFLPITGNLPRVEFARRGTPVEEPPRAAPELRVATTPPPLEQVLPPLATPDSVAAREDSSEIPPVVEPDSSSLPVHAEPRTLPAPAPRRDSAPATPAREPAAREPAKRAAAPPASTTPVRTAPSVPNPAAAAPVVPAPAAASTNDDTDWPLVCGVVEDAYGVPLPGARVSVAELSFAIRTDSRGRFCLSAPAGPHSLVLEAPGMPPQRENVTFAAGAPDLHLRLRGR